MSVKQIQALMTGLVVLACVVGGIILIIKGINHTVGVVLLVIVGSYQVFNRLRLCPLPGQVQLHFLFLSIICLNHDNPLFAFFCQVAIKSIFF
ncbi:hypothetical protein ES705_16532 [subsurface metagenome]